ncbi:unnamed protein product [Meganyctiphanes norvegica]|uniref:Caspase n=1 Tax=Meganyctiphanes norvegica TaxID=48144 RepID=A0AAV2SND7_MEGNR
MGDNDRLLQLLQSGGHNVNDRNPWAGGTALHWAARHDRVSTMALLVDHGADLSVRDSDNNTPLHDAAWGNNHAAVNWLLQRPEVDATATNKAGKTAADVADRRGHTQLGAMIRARVAAGCCKGIINVFNYIDFVNKSNKRHGAQEDTTNIRNTFTTLNYDVKIHENFTKQQTHDKFKELQSDQTLTSLIVIILSHGNDRFSFMASDEQILDLDELRRMFTDSSCPNLRGKPKVFLANFCRGARIELVPDTVKLEPPHNTVTIHAATEGIKALRNVKKGSVFIMSLCKILKDHPKWELRQIFNELYRQMKEEGGTTPFKETFAPMEDFYF